MEVTIGSRMNYHRYRLSGLNEIDFVVENNTAVGFAVGYHQIFRTSFEYFGGEPGGNSGSYPGWVPVNSGTTTGFLTCVDYINPFVAYAVGGPNRRWYGTRHLF